MTKKRFEIKIGEFEEENIVDNLNRITICEISDMCQKMNELAEENQQLRKLLDIGKTNAKDIVDVLNIQQREIRELEKQREELFIRERDTKNELRELKGFIKSLCDKNNEIWLDDGSIYRLRKVFKGEWVE